MSVAKRLFGIWEFPKIGVRVSGLRLRFRILGSGFPMISGVGLRASESPPQNLEEGEFVGFRAQGGLLDQRR